MSRFMDILKTVGEAVQQAPGLSNAIADIKAEASRKVELGASELANALFHGQGFVLYGPNGRPAEHEKPNEPEQEREPEQPQMESPQHTQGRSM